MITNTEGFVPLWRKSLNNEVRRHDKTAWYVFETLLLICDYRTGIWSGGRFQLAELCCMKPTTLYKCIKRLEKRKMVTLSSNNKYTVITICKVKEYSAYSNNVSNNTVTTEGQHSNTLTINKREIKEEEPFRHFLKPHKTKTKLSKQGTAYAFAKELCEYFNSELGGQYLTDDNLLAGVNLFEQHGRDKVLLTANYIIHLPPKEYQVKVRSPKELAQKWPKVIELMEKPMPKETLLDKAIRERISK